MNDRRVGLWLIGACGGVGSTATLGLAALARGLGVTSMVLASMADLEGKIHAVHALPGPLLVNVKVDHGGRTSRCIEAGMGRSTRELLARQRTRFLAWSGVRSLAIVPWND